MAYRRRESTKKSSAFKIQTEKSVFSNFMSDIADCASLKAYPGLKEDLIQETSQTIYNYCYSFREDSPFTKGLNYYCKEVGFSNFENLVTYKEYLPGVREAYLMGEFNDFNKVNHAMVACVGEECWFKVEINGSMISDGSRLTLRVIDYQGTEYNMIPPSCVVAQGNYGVYLGYRKCPLVENPLRPQELLAFVLDIQEITWDKLLDFLKQNKNVLERFTTVILKNAFAGKRGLLHKYSLEQANLQTFQEAIQFINKELCLKVSLSWNCEESKQHYGGNPIEDSYSVKSNGEKCQWSVQNSDVFAFYLSLFSFYKNYFGIDGFFLEGIDSLSSSVSGVTLLKCIGVLKDRLSEHGITMASMKGKVPAVCEKLLDGGMGIMYATNSSEKLDLGCSKGHEEIIKVVQASKPFSNCLEIKISEMNPNQDISERNLNVYLAYMASEKGIFCYGHINSQDEVLRKVLKLRGQTELFQQPFKVLEISKDRIFAERGRSLIFFNYSQEVVSIEYEGICEAELIFNSGIDEPVREGATIKLVGKSCVLLERPEI